MKSLIVTTASVFLTTTVVFNAYWQKKQFYPSVVYLTKSNASLAVIYLQAFVLVLLAGKLARKVFFGQLRTIEMEHLIERSWYAVTETCLAFTVFRDDLSPKFVSLFTILLFLKCFHWLAEDRVDVMERSPNISWLFHIRLLSLLCILACADMTGVKLAYESTLTKGASVQLVFGFEYAILLVSVLNVAIKYGLHVVDYVRANANRDNVTARNWEEKAVYLLYSELLLSGSKVVLYLTFISLMMKIHTFPLFAIRPVYLSMRSFKKALNDVIQSRRAIANMNSLYPNATAQELQDTDNVCIICREEMQGTTVTNGQVMNPGSGLSKKLPCGHIFHVSCLRSWFQRQQTCPTCRLDVLRASVASRVLNNNNNPGTNPAVNPPQLQPHNPGAVNLDPQQQQFLQQMFVTHFMLNQLAAQPAVPAPQPPPPHPPSDSPAPLPGSATSAATEAATNPPSAPVLPGPMPSPPADLSVLSDAEVLALIRNEREGLEARLKLYSQSRTLIDAAINNLLQFNAALEVAGGAASSVNETMDPGQERLTRVTIPPELISPDSSGRFLNEDETVRRRSNSAIRRARVTKFSGGSNEKSGQDGNDHCSGKDNA